MRKNEINDDDALKSEEESDRTNKTRAIIEHDPEDQEIHDERVSINDPLHKKIDKKTLAKAAEKITVSSQEKKKIKQYLKFRERSGRIINFINGAGAATAIIRLAEIIFLGKKHNFSQDNYRIFFLSFSECHWGLFLYKISRYE